MDYTGKNKFKWDSASNSIITIPPKKKPKAIGKKNPLAGRKYTVDKSGHVQFQNSGGKISKYYAGGGNVITGRD